MPEHETESQISVASDEPDAQLKRTLLSGLGLDAVVRPLDFGDYAWECPLGYTVLERKEANDLVTSIQTGRLDDQMERCLSGAEVVILLREGHYGERGGKIFIPGSPVDMDYDRVNNLLLKWQARGVLLVDSPSPSSTHMRIASLYHWSQVHGPDFQEVMPRRRRLPNLGRLSEHAEILAGLPGIGTKRAELLAAQAPLRDILGAWGEDEFVSVTGSRALAKKVVALLEEAP